ncbi:MAG: hypothetical protein HQK62_14755 [Desulfamplus sp.]|nr:hypothetical protein [Desulfamplus sp.]
MIFNDNKSCPECNLTNVAIEMILNKNSFWECPLCHLQTTRKNAALMVFTKRGKGDFINNHRMSDKHTVGAFLARYPKSEGWFESQEEFIEFIQKVK